MLKDWPHSNNEEQVHPPVVACGSFSPGKYVETLRSIENHSLCVVETIAIQGADNAFRVTDLQTADSCKLDPIYYRRTLLFNGRRQKTNMTKKS